MESVQSHLGRRLADTLSSDGAYILASVDQRLEVFMVVHLLEVFRLDDREMLLQSMLAFFIQGSVQCVLLHILLY